MFVCHIMYISKLVCYTRKFLLDYIFTALFWLFHVYVPPIFSGICTIVIFYCTGFVTDYKAILEQCH